MMLSRVADNLYWLGRYLERAEHLLRLLKVGQDMQFDMQRETISWAWRRIGSGVSIPELAEADDYTLVETVLLDNDSGSVLSNVRLARDNARQVREQISTEMWEQLNRLHIGLSSVKLQDCWNDNIFEFFQSQLRELHLFEGTTNSTLNHGEGWQFLQIGRLIERAANTVMLIDFYARDWDKTSASSRQYLNWVMLLRDCTAFEAYCKVYSADLRFPQIVEFLLLNSEFPHAVHHALLSVKLSLDQIASTTATDRNTRLYRLIGRLTAKLRYADLDEILAEDLHAYLLEVKQACDTIHAVIYDTYIGYSIEQMLPDYV